MSPMKNLELVVSILQVGFVGFAFLLAFLAYRLLRNESDKDKPKTAILQATSKYMTFAVVLCFLAVSAQFGQSYLERNEPQPTDSPSADLIQQVESLKEKVTELNSSFARAGERRDGDLHVIDSDLAPKPDRAQCRPGTFISMISVSKANRSDYATHGVAEITVICSPIFNR
jgi:hypothetical protein